MKPRTRAVLAVVAIAIAGAVVAFASMIRRGFSAHEEPSRIDAAMARAIVSWF